MSIRSPAPLLAIDRPAPRLKFAGIEAARGVAAVLVAIYHGSRLVAQSRYAGEVPAWGLFGDFNAGVDFFFVLSGFLITWVHWFDIGQPSRLRRYLIRRFTRIYPAYWIVLFPLVVARLFHVGNTATQAPGLGDIICSILLLPNVVQPVLGVGWTLVYEVFFYWMFGCAMLIGKRSAILAVLWAGAILVYNIAEASPSFPDSFFFSPYILEFLIGVAAATLLRRNEFPFSRSLAILGALLFGALMLSRVDRFIGNSAFLVLRLGFGMCAAILVIGAVDVERLRGAIVPAWVRLLGAASYSIYLLHTMIEPVVLLALWPHIKGISPTVITIGLACFGIAGGILFHKLVEGPLMRRLRV